MNQSVFSHIVTKDIDEWSLELKPWVFKGQSFHPFVVNVELERVVLFDTTEMGCRMDFYAAATFLEDGCQSPKRKKGTIASISTSQGIGCPWRTADR